MVPEEPKPEEPEEPEPAEVEEPEPAEPEEQGYDDESRTEIPPYFITYDFNFIDGANYDQVCICEIGEELSYKDAMDKAVELANEKDAFGFFYQMHNNGYQIVGFYMTEDEV